MVKIPRILDPEKFEVFGEKRMMIDAFDYGHSCLHLTTVPEPAPDAVFSGNSMAGTPASAASEGRPTELSAAEDDEEDEAEAARLALCELDGGGTRRGRSTTDGAFEDDEEDEEEEEDDEGSTVV